MLTISPGDLTFATLVTTGLVIMALDPETLCSFSFGDFSHCTSLKLSFKGASREFIKLLGFINQDSQFQICH